MKTEKLTIINEEFGFDEAKEVLMDLFHSKINFHNIKKLEFSRTLWER